MGRQELGEAATLHELSVSTMLSMEALVRVLVRKGIVTEKEVMDELRTVRMELPETPGGLSDFEKGP